LESKGTALISQGDKMFKVFLPQIDLEDILKFDKVQAYVAEKFRSRNFGTSRNSSKVFWLY
jgi:hypothetical protein